MLALTLPRACARESESESERKKRAVEREECSQVLGKKNRRVIVVQIISQPVCRHVSRTHVECVEIQGSFLPKEGEFNKEPNYNISLVIIRSPCLKTGKKPRKCTAFIPSQLSRFATPVGT